MGVRSTPRRRLHVSVTPLFGGGEDFELPVDNLNDGIKSSLPSTANNPELDAQLTETNQPAEGKVARNQAHHSADN